MFILKGLKGYSGEKCRCFFIDNITVWRLLALLVVICLSVCFYLYTHGIGGLGSTPVVKVVEGNVKAAWKDKFTSILHHLNLVKHSDKIVDLEAITHGRILRASSLANLKAAMKGVSTTQPNTASELMKKHRTMIELNQTMPVLTLFTTWKETADKYLVHNLTTANWLSLRPYVIPVVFTNESSVADKCLKQGWKVLPIRVAAAEGIPVLKFMYIDVIAAFNSTFYGYANGDVLFTDDLVKTLISIANEIDLEKPTLIVGKRTNVQNVTKDEGSSWVNITRVSKERGTLFRGDAEDYFLAQWTYPWKDIPEVVIGRRAYDNWLVYNARKSKHHVIDITNTSLAVHQTTAAGNYEGHGKNHGEYNVNVLKKMYTSIRFSLGLIDCINQETKYDEKGVIGLHAREIPKSCNL